MHLFHFRRTQKTNLQPFHFQNDRDLVLNWVKGFKNEVLPRLFLQLILTQAPNCSVVGAVFLEDLLEMSQIWPGIFIHVMI